MSDNKVARFSKINLENFCRDYKATFQSETVGASDKEIAAVYDSIKLPSRATKASAGYDFFSPIDLVLKPGDTVKVPTGIRCEMDADIVLLVFPRSSLGFKYRMMLENTVGVIDSDYFYSDNQGHIFIKFTNHGEKEFTIKAGAAFAQGIFTKYYLTHDDEVSAVRNGGIGSTN